MTTIEKTLEKDCYLDSVFPDGIPTNTILNKTICGCGATYLELKTRRHSIIIEPNVPVIKGKIQKHYFLLGVFEGVTEDDIISYLVNSSGKFKKIMTTPDSFFRVMKVLWAQGVNPYTAFFLLFDECDRIVKDSNYRERITLPIADFFKFKNKAMVSATPIVVPDPRFEKQNFQIIRINPNYNYKTDIEVIPTNNIQLTLKKILDEIDDSKQVCIFFNSPTYIKSLINYLEIKDQSNIYCSSTAVEKLRDKGWINSFDFVQDAQGINALNKYNFFTSRFYSALDIDLDFKPVVISLTDAYVAPYSFIDPATDSVQIAGRFRNGIEKYIHIANYNNYIKYWKEQAITDYLDGKHLAYTKIRQMFQQSRNYGERALLNEALQKVTYNHYVTPTGEKDYFRHTNAILSEYVKSIYEKPYTIKKAYLKVSVLNMNYSPCYWCITDSERRELNSNQYSAEKKNKTAYNLFFKLRNVDDPYQKPILEELKREYLLVYECYLYFKYDGLLHLNFNKTELKKSVDFAKKISGKIKRAVYTHFKANNWYLTKEINDFLKPLYTDNNIEIDNRGIADNIVLYFVAEERKKKKGHGWQLHERQS